MNPLAPTLPLPDLIGALGQDHFETTLASSLRQLTGADHCLLISWQEDSHHPLTLFSRGDIYQPLARECRNLYDEHYFRRDSNLDWLRHQAVSGLPKVRYQQAQELADGEYRHQLLERCGIREKLAFLYQNRGQALCLNLYRLESPDSRPLESDALQQQGCVLAALLERHISLARQNRMTFDLTWVRARLTSALGERLTVRELDVGSRIVLGYRSEAIALDLGVSTNTVLTHRRNLYDKLGISTQNQLFAIVVEGHQPGLNRQ